MRGMILSEKQALYHADTVHQFLLLTRSRDSARHYLEKKSTFFQLRCMCSYFFFSKLHFYSDIPSGGTIIFYRSDATATIDFSALKSIVAAASDRVQFGAESIWERHLLQKSSQRAWPTIYFFTKKSRLLACSTPRLNSTGQAVGTIWESVLSLRLVHLQSCGLLFSRALSLRHTCSYKKLAYSQAPQWFMDIENDIYNLYRN